MSFLKIGKQNSGPIELHYHDRGTGQPVVLIHGWPLSERSWEKQESVLLAQGYRVITYDRRGFGESSKPAFGYDYDTLAGDLNTLMSHLELRNAILVGFSMGTGEVARYVKNFGSSRVAKVVFISGILPALLKSPDNPEGVDSLIFDDIMKQLIEDRPAYLTRFFKDFYSYNRIGHNDVSKEVMRFSWNIGVMASPIATLKCVSSWLEDFRADVAHIDVPSLVIHGDSDRILPINATAERLKRMLRGCEYLEVKGGPHGLLMSHAHDVNTALLKFFGTVAEKKRASAEMQH